MIVIHTTFFELGDDGRGKSLVYSDALFVKSRGVMQTWPEDLITELVVAALGLGKSPALLETTSLIFA